MFRHDIAYVFNSFVFSVDIPVMINILYEIFLKFCAGKC